MNACSPTRRSFLKAGGAFVLTFSFAPEIALSQAKPPQLPGSLSTNRMLDAWIRIGADGRITIFTGKIELGQGIGTALAQIAADELDVDIKRIEMIHGDTERTPDEGQTAGSLSVTNSGTALRFACAEARALLLDAAAAKLGSRPPRSRFATAAYRALPTASPTGSSRRIWTSSAKSARKSNRKRLRSISGSARASRAATFPRSSPGAPLTCRMFVCRTWCTAASCIRHRPARS